MKQPRAFTLLELLLAAAITTVLAGLSLLVISDCLEQWNRMTGRQGVESAARLALDQLEQDFQGAFRCPAERTEETGGVWLAVTVLADTRLSGQWKSTPVSANAKPANTHPRTLNLSATDIADARFGVAGVWLRLITTKPDTGTNAADLSAPVVVGYQIIRRNVTSSVASEQRYMLFRGEVRRTRTAGGAPGTFEAGYNLDPAASPSTPYMDANATAGDPGNLIRPPLGAVVADNVIDFGVRLYVGGPETLRLVFPAAPAEQGAPPVNGMVTSAVPPSSQTEHLARSVPPDANDYYRHAFPEVAEVMVRILTDEGARLVAAFEAGRIQPPAGVAPADHWWNLAEAHSLVFTRRIVLPGRPL